MANTLLLKDQKNNTNNVTMSCIVHLTIRVTISIESTPHLHSLFIRGALHIHCPSRECISTGSRDVGEQL